MGDEPDPDPLFGRRVSAADAGPLWREQKRHVFHVDQIRPPRPADRAGGRAV